jgi:thiamine-phosphate pyrophosphorylase
MRILDANANRAAEGFRTLEETARFALNSVKLSAQFKSLRHMFAEATSRLPRRELLEARDTVGDVGTTMTTPSEQQRDSTSSIVAAAAARTQQALRCLEEYGKTINADFATDIEQIRYRTYDACAQLELLSMAGCDRRARLQGARLYALLDAAATEQEMVQRIHCLAAAGVDIIQLRDSRVNDRTLYTRAVAGQHAAREHGVLWIINDRADIAAAADADGVHVGQEELPVEQVRRVVGVEKIVGLSTHNMQQVSEALASTADYIGCGPVFPGHTKTFAEFPGCEFLRAVRDHFLSQQGSDLSPVAFAIGGITTRNVGEITAAGFGRIAVTGALAEGTIATNAAALRQALAHIPLSTI